MNHVEKLKDLIDSACVVMDMPDSRKLAEYLVEHGVRVLESPLIGTTVFVFREIAYFKDGTCSDRLVRHERYLRPQSYIKTDFYVDKKPLAKTDIPKLGKSVFLTEAEAEAKLEKLRAEWEKETAQSGEEK